MKNSTISMLVFAIYMSGMSLCLILYPELFLWLGFADITGPFVPTLGYVVGALAFFYFMAIRAELTQFYQWTVYARAPLIGFFSLLVYLKIAPPIMLLIGFWDTGCAFWTAYSLRRERETAS